MRLLTTLLLLFVFYLVIKLLIGFTYLSNQRRKRREQLGGEMVCDPVCETYVPKSTAIEKKMNGETLYFCSQPCLDAYLRKNG
jgi:uncharacterized protein